jgi:sortase (surface protein transpeptidase)
LRAALTGLAGLSLLQTGIARGQDGPVEPDGSPSEPAGPAGFVAHGIPPISLAIPDLGVDATVIGVALDDDGAMAVPPNPDAVAWYTLGPGMGVGGNVVFAGHIDWDGRPRVFGRLTNLRPDDAVLVVDAAGNGYEYRVESAHWVRAEGAPVEEIFGQTDAATITLITCGGEYRPETREYLDRLIVRARGA